MKREFFRAVVVSIVVLLCTAGVAQKILEEDYAAKAMRAAMPSDAQCVNSPTGPICQYQSPAFNILMSMIGNELIIKVTVKKKISVLVADLTRSVVAITSQYGFDETQSMTCFREGMKKHLSYMESLSLVMLWGQNKGGYVKNKDTQLECLELEVDDGNAYVWRITANDSF